MDPKPRLLTTTTSYSILLGEGVEKYMLRGRFKVHNCLFLSSPWFGSQVVSPQVTINWALYWGRFWSFLRPSHDSQGVGLRRFLLKTPVAKVCFSITNGLKKSIFWRSSTSDVKWMLQICLMSLECEQCIGIFKTNCNRQKSLCGFLWGLWVEVS